jgi:hypothetical protein
MKFLLLALLTLPCLAQKIVSRGTYELYAERHDGIHQPQVATTEKRFLQLNLFDSEAGYVLRGFSLEMHNGVVDKTDPIVDARVGRDSVPYWIVFRSNVMGVPDNKWLLFFFDGGEKLTVEDFDHRMYYFYHRTKWPGVDSSH